MRQLIGDKYAQAAVIEESFGPLIRVVAIILWISMLAGAGVPCLRSALLTKLSPPYLNQDIVRVGKFGNSAYRKIAGFLGCATCCDRAIASAMKTLFRRCRRNGLRMAHPIPDFTLRLLKV